MNISGHGSDRVLEARHIRRDVQLEEGPGGHDAESVGHDQHNAVPALQAACIGVAEEERVAEHIAALRIAKEQ